MKYSDPLTEIKLIKIKSFTSDSVIMFQGLYVALCWALLIRDHIPVDLREIYCAKEIITTINIIILQYMVPDKK